MTELIALRPLTYGTRRMRPGETFRATASHARLLVAIGRARYETATIKAEEPELQDLPAEEAAPKPRRKRTYKRRDMRAED